MAAYQPRYQEPFEVPHEEGTEEYELLDEFNKNLLKIATCKKRWPPAGKHEKASIVQASARSLVKTVEFFQSIRHVVQASLARAIVMNDVDLIPWLIAAGANINGEVAYPNVDEGDLIYYHMLSLAVDHTGT
jgi:hypothetical protein